jgi:hypothetical protein
VKAPCAPPRCSAQSTRTSSAIYCTVGVVEIDNGFARCRQLRWPAVTRSLGSLYHKQMYCDFAHFVRQG